MIGKQKVGGKDKATGYTAEFHAVTPFSIINFLFCHDAEIIKQRVLVIQKTGEGRCKPVKVAWKMFQP